MLAKWPVRLSIGCSSVLSAKRDPIVCHPTDRGFGTTLLTSCLSSDRQRLRHAFFARSIRLVLRCFFDPVPPVTPQPSRTQYLDHSHPDLDFRKTCSVCLGHCRCRCCRPEQNLPQLPHRKTDPGRLCRRCPLCRLLVSLHNILAPLWLAGLGARYFHRKVLPPPRPGR